MSKVKEYIYLVITDQINSVPAAVLKFLLSILAVIYGFIVSLILLFYRLKIFRQKKLALSAIGVGNITWGGSGKTPLAIYLAKNLKNSGCKPAILTRGYAAKAGLVDEAQVLSLALQDVPVIVGKNRVASAKIAKDKYQSDVLILDDAFQQWKIKKDLEIVVINAGNPFGNGKLIPRGILREPLSSLRRADVFVLNKVDSKIGDFEEMKSLLNLINPKALFVEARYQAFEFCDEQNRNFPLDSWKGRNSLLVSGLADPFYFEQMIRELGVKITEHLRFRDHHAYVPEDIDNILLKAVQNENSAIVTTEKDLVKIKIYSSEFKQKGLKLLALRIGIKITENEKAFLEKISHVFNT